MRFVVVFMVLSLVGVQGVGLSVVKNTLKCYQCVVSSNDQCIDEYHLKLCPNDQAYDHCMTTVQSTAGTGVVITKKCVLGFCSLRDSMASTALGMNNQCDLSKPSYYCTSCCNEDGCNRDATAAVAANYVIHHTYLYAFLIISLILSAFT